MIRLADFNLHVGCEGGGQSQPRPKNPENQRVAALDEFDPAAQADAQRFKPLRFLVINRDLADDGANPRRELVQPDESVRGFSSGCHSKAKISRLAGKSMNPTGGGLRIAVGELR